MLTAGRRLGHGEGNLGNIKHQAPLKVGVMLGLKQKDYLKHEQEAVRILTQPPCPARHMVSFDRLWSTIRVARPKAALWYLVHEISQQLGHSSPKIFQKGNKGYIKESGI